MATVALVTFRSAEISIPEKPTMDLSSILRIAFLLKIFQPLLMGRWFTCRRLQKIRAIESKRGTCVITMFHRQEKQNLLDFSVSRHIDLEDDRTVIAAIRETPRDKPIDLVLHTPGGLVLAAMQIARLSRLIRQR